MRRRPDEHCDRGGQGSGTDGARNEKRRGSRARGLPRRAYAEKALQRGALFAHRRRHFSPAAESGLNRGIRSFVLRQGRTTPSQQRALEELMPRFGISFSDSPLDAVAAFGRKAPLVLEIGSGMGETTAEIARADPGIDYLAIEVHGPGVGSLLKKIDELGLKNLRVLRHDAVEALEKMIADGMLAGLHLFFPDPWPKKRHHKRRLVQPPFVALVARKLAPGGYFHAATDWSEYAEQIESVLAAEPMLEKAGQAKNRPLTKFERRGLNLGHPVRDLLFLRRKE
ncbi:MAG: tRNA (guanosine(46)-N7)-methyltransferase TrmB [Candidatus Parcubacteria bacterium]|nr:tRNA (guanosine(46)-N7)-methyltransferase TrmB [Burkholderiales bacterium]